MNTEKPQREIEDGKRKYQNDDLVVYWDAKQCSHSGKCWQRLPKVFIPTETPWIKIDDATPEEIIEIIDLCPTDALKYELPQGSRVNPDIAQGPGSVNFIRKSSTEEVQINMVQDGPLVVKGQARIISPKGEILKESNRMVLCACGKSSTRPFCDGSHMR
ncbi:MAG: hypothetical protein CVU87_01310 [Firmicutes bacterium HGW-Firmicutes-12]|jgi:uncharacterized Fe-S cluster protein YjdI|nr:MAG: hypothetical protein CVU87_01310 [Firmicutes bacterium HGW-Firmicutes-12]